MAGEWLGNGWEVRLVRLVEKQLRWVEVEANSCDFDLLSLITSQKPLFQKTVNYLSNMIKNKLSC